MPIYAYRCEECGFAKDVLQKMSDDPLTVCLECGKASFKKQVTAAGFQLKGSGWYVTDFRGGSGAKADNSDSAGKSGGGGESTPSVAAPDTSSAVASASTTATSPTTSASENKAA